MKKTLLHSLLFVMSIASGKAQLTCETAIPLTIGDTIHLVDNPDALFYVDDLGYNRIIVNPNWFVFQTCDAPMYGYWGNSWSGLTDYLFTPNFGSFQEQTGTLVTTGGPFTIMDVDNACATITNQVLSYASSNSGTLPYTQTAEYYYVVAGIPDFGIADSLIEILDSWVYFNESEDVSIGLDCVNCNPLPSNEICVITTNENNQNKVIFTKQPDDSNVAEYRLLRFGFDLENPDLVATSTASDSSFIVDTQVSASEQAYSYIIEAVDTCGVEIRGTSPHTTMHLSANLGTNGFNNLIWTPYNGAWENTYDRFYLMRGTQPDNMEVFDSVAVNIFGGPIYSYTDVTAPSGTVYYQVGFVLESTCEVTRDYMPWMVKSNYAGANIIISMTDEEATNKLQVFPNPSTEMFTIDYSAFKAIPSNIRCIDATGRMLENIKPFNSTQTTINCNHWDAGIYFIQIEYADRVITKSVVVD